ncbi:GntP family permease [Neomoorella humiferrea]|uniref:Inner membrane permease YgbN n=1 Tax=Neomoorella humiferrea TaxID=676965 RepID=A0A2T0AV57_9FIRM|nr:gluconate:H+ symporter [Moorella humiferrea]PRR74468.1 Inner membrane permease YgbN [Moorella humiferrea]
MSGPLLLLVVVAVIILLILLVSKVRLNAFLALIVTSIVLGLLGGIKPVEVVKLVTEGFGGLMANIGIVIALGVIIGEFLEATGGAEKIAESVLKVVGRERSVLAMGITGGIVSIPVFCDSGFVILNPVIKALSRVGKVPLFSLSTALMAGLLTTHVFVPPTPGPIAAAGILGADLGKVVFYGILVSIPPIIVCSLWANSRFIRNKFPKLAEEDKIIEDQEAARRAKCPSTIQAYLPIVIPIILIVLQSFGNQLLPKGSSAQNFLGFIGHPVTALLIGTALAFTLAPLGNKDIWDTWVGRALEKSTIIILVTAAAGSFGKILGATGIGEYLGKLIAGSGVPGILLPFLISAFILTAQGSATVALLTTSAIVKPMLPALGLSPELAVLAIAAGAVTVVHANGSYFWVVVKFSNMDITEGYWSVTLTTLILGIVGFLSVAVLSLFI